VVEIADTGIGFAPTTAGGVGLTNIRDRVRLLYGDRGTLAIRENAPSGTIVSLRIPA
jgi:signal transduction histidine kinase